MVLLTIVIVSASSNRADAMHFSKGSAETQWMQDSLAMCGLAAQHGPEYLRPCWALYDYKGRERLDDCLQ